MNEASIKLDLKDELNIRFNKEVDNFKSCENTNNMVMYVSLITPTIQLIINSILVSLSDYNVYLLGPNLLFLLFVVFNFIYIKKLIYKNKEEVKSKSFNMKNMDEFINKRKEDIEVLNAMRCFIQGVYSLFFIIMVLNVAPEIVGRLDVFVCVFSYLLIFMFTAGEGGIVLNTFLESVDGLINFEKNETIKIMNEKGFDMKEIKSTVYVKRNE